jgi:O-antigen biosynthesis protein
MPVEWPLELLDDMTLPRGFASPATPHISVIIPTYGKLAYTLACLRSLARHSATVAFEVIVVDDAAPDADIARLKDIEGITLIRNVANLGFIGSCNTAALQARGKYLLFLNNDTQVTPGWMDSLLECFDDHTCGIAGSQLIYPDGRLQEAGAIVYADGQAWNYGRFDSRHDPRFLYRRDADYVSGAALMIETALFRSLDGFDMRYAPAYCEDMDLAFAAKAAGRRIVYQPESVVIHFEGVSSGLDPFAGVKQYQLANRAKFAEKWRTQLQQQPPAGMPEGRALGYSVRRRILIVDALMPDPTRDSGSLRMINIMRLLREMGWHISFMPDNGRAEPAEIALLGRLGVETLCKPWSGSLAQWLKLHGSSLDAVMLCRHYVAGAHLTLVRSLAQRARLLFDTVDLHFLREQRAAEVTGSASLARQAETSRQRELELISKSDTTLVVSPIERVLLAKDMPQARVELVSNVHEIHGRQAEFAPRSGLVFVGGFGHPPNEDAVQWLVAEILPLIRAQRPDIRLHLIGDMPETMRKSFARPGVEIHGRVSDLAPWMNSCRIALAPLRYGAGVKGKVNMAMSFGLPVVATTIASEGMMVTDDKDILVADTAAQFARAVLRLHENEPLWYRLSDNGLANVEQYFSFDAARKTLLAILP